MLLYHNKKEPRKFHTHTWNTAIFVVGGRKSGGFYDGGCPKFLNFFKIKFYNKNIFLKKITHKNVWLKKIPIKFFYD